MINKEISLVLTQAEIDSPEDIQIKFHVYSEDDLNIAVKRKIDAMIQRGNYLKDKKTELTEEEKRHTKPTKSDLLFWPKTKPGDSYSVQCMKQQGKGSFFTHIKLSPDKAANTLTGTSWTINHWDKCRKLTFREWKRLGSFPDDYEAKTDKIGKYMIGMSVPPKMTEVVARAVIDQWLK